MAKQVSGVDSNQRGRIAIAQCLNLASGVVGLSMNFDLNQGEVVISGVMYNLDVLGIENQIDYPGGGIWWSRRKSNPW